jgi:hypothetical protein
MCGIGCRAQVYRWVRRHTPSDSVERQEVCSDQAVFLSELRTLTESSPFGFAPRWSLAPVVSGLPMNKERPTPGHCRRWLESAPLCTAMQLRSVTRYTPANKAIWNFAYGVYKTQKPYGGCTTCATV